MVEFQEIVSNQPPFRAKAFIEYDEQLKARIVCKEPTCNFYVNEKCTNKKAMIEDDCPADSWCITYVSRN